LEKKLNQRSSAPKNSHRSISKLQFIGLSAAAALAVTALVVARRAQRAEQENPAAGKFIDIDGVHLHYLERGEGPPLVLLHGNGTMVQDFEISGLITLLAKEYRVVAFDRPGFGHTDRPRNRVWGPEAQSELFWHAMRRLGLDHAAVIGHSWGTMVALALALRHPESVRGLLLLS
jgi:alpha-beta hydrolase superfamily lysophospholipase